MQKLWISALVFLTVACAEPPPAANGSNAQSSAAQENPVDKPMPAGFLDAPPAPPTSNTVVLSGGNLVLDDVSTDTAIVISNGRLITWGRRGDVDMPNDSIGHDMRGKWLTPGSIADLEAGSLPNLEALRPNELANMLVFNTGPDLSEVSGDDLHAVVSEGEIQVFDAPSD